MSVGAVAVAFNAWWSPQEIAYAVEHTRPRVVVADTGLDPQRSGRDAAPPGPDAASGLPVTGKPLPGDRGLG
ncbi:hypothetical protein GCM10009676_13750 [Prauserella halophila]|uniref:AMP-binding enzyme n=1 Tax=Prauserella halophila TaxID=185641 RepID=A0ABN1W2L5_9PSEU